MGIQLNTFEFNGALVLYNAALTITTVGMYLKISFNFSLKTELAGPVTDDATVELCTRVVMGRQIWLR